MDDGYKPFAVIKNAINKLETQRLLKLSEKKVQVVELIVKDLVQAGILREFINICRPHPTNRHKSLEELISEGGRIIFIRKMEFDAHQSTFTLELQCNPESDTVDKILIFRNIESFEETLDDDEEDLTDYIDSIIGLDEYSTKYVLKTDTREITFYSEAIPEILSVKERKNVQ